MDSLNLRECTYLSIPPFTLEYSLMISPSYVLQGPEVARIYPVSGLSPSSALPPFYALPS